MEFNRMFTVVQGVLCSFQKSSGVKLSDITEDYPEELERLVEILRNVIKDNDWDEASQRKIHLFLILNTDFEHVTLFEEDENFRHLVGITPQLSSFLYVQIVTRLDWHHLVGEVILHCPEALVRDILRSFEYSMKHIHSDKAVPFFYSLYESLFHKIVLLENVCKHRTIEFMKLFKALTKYKFKEVIASLGCSSEESKYYLGYVYRMYIKLVESCIGRLQNHTVVKEELYAFKIYYDYTVWPVSTTTNWGYHCLGALASAAVDISVDVNIDTYMTWNDVTVPEDSTKTLQLSVREAAYNTRTAIASMPTLKNSVAGLPQLESCLGVIAFRPTTEDDEIASADLDSLMTNLKNPKRNRVKWLNALIERSHFDNDSVLDMLKTGHEIATVDTALLLLDRAALYIRENPLKSSESIKEICRIYVRSLSRHDQQFLLKKYFEGDFIGKHFASANFDRNVVAFFNNATREAVTDDKVIGEMTWLAIEDCEGLLKACVGGCLESKKKAEMVVDLLTEIRPVAMAKSTATQEPIIVAHLLNHMDSSSSDGRFPLLIKLLSINKLLDVQPFLLSHIIPKLIESISDGNLTSVTFYMDVLIVTEPYVPLQSTAYIAFLARSLNKLRPRIDTFNLNSCEATTRCIILLNDTVERFTKRKDSEDDEVTWLRSLSERLHPLTRVHLIQLWKHWGKTSPQSCDKEWCKRGFGYDVELNDLEHDKRAALVTYLVKTIPVLTAYEWQNVAGGQREMNDPRLTYSVFTVLADCVLVLFQVPFNGSSNGKSSLSPPIKSCLAYSLTNFLALVKFACLKHLTKWTPQQITSARDKLDQISANLPDGVNSEDLLEGVRMHFTSNGVAKSGEP